MKHALLSEKVKRLFTIGCAWEVEESLTTLGTIVAWEFLNCCRPSNKWYAHDYTYPINKNTQSPCKKRALSLKYFWRLIVSMLISSNYFLFQFFFVFFIVEPEVSPFILFPLVPET
jgi:hypothetical protein